MIVHLGDGVIISVDKEIGVNKNEDAIQILSPPENGMTPRTTWLTTSESALNHLRLCFGNVGHYRRIILASDGADSVCRGSNVSHRARKLLVSGSRRDIGDFISGTSYIDDCSVCVIDTYPCLLYTSCHMKVSTFVEKSSQGEMGDAASLFLTFQI